MLHATPLRTPTLQNVQDALSSLYDLEVAARVDDFVCDEATARALGGDDAVRRREVLFVLEDEEGTHVGLYLAEDAREAAADPRAWLTRFDAMCLAAEGVSHFVLVQARAAEDRPVREIELELQAEVDKYALGLLDALGFLEPKIGPEGGGLRHEGPSGEALLGGNGVGLLRARSREVRRRLFEDATLIDGPGTERGERYRAATTLAAAYTRQLERKHVDRGNLRDLVKDLRRFYRLGLADKLDRCRTG